MADGSLCRLVTRVCKICGQAKPESEFYPIKKWFDSYCKPCRCAYQRDLYVKTKPERQAYERSRATLPHRVEARRTYIKSNNGKEAMRAAHRREYRKFPEKFAARSALRKAIKSGDVARGACKVCGKTDRIHGHHEDYSKPLDVIWLCDKHHRELHASIKDGALSSDRAANPIP